jgi:hypothetical protein
VLEAQIKRRPAMKKVSNVAATPGKQISQQKLTVGLDLSGKRPLLFFASFIVITTSVIRTRGDLV